jgi:cell division protein FtsQ
MEIRQPFTRRTHPRRNRFINVNKPAAAAPAYRKFLLPFSLVLLGIVSSVMLFPYVEKQVNQPIAKVIVKGDLVFLDRREVMDRVPVYQGNRLLDINLESVRKNLEAMPWIYSAQVSRQWPDVISINVVEQKPIAYWNDRQLMNQYGAVFSREGKVVNDLPSLFGIHGSELNVVQRFLEFSQLLAPLGLKIVRLRQDEQLAWEVDTGNGIHLQLGSTQALEKMRRFVYLYQNQLQQDTRSVAVVDLRYNSGAAVKWL